ncbi:GNAT family N-acetyltransferase [Flavobacterium algicola]|uniref:GNAT family N-acetyltransferase n=1 Tax=Flavobacterium algicola TaxID=556529 RepID=UPI001EFD86B7|nr:GNAT family N-acetyltransferase [Flavobacterium algicola]MCG9793237.1 GNAT family N-acetyltransferase [Flavobacterium algicola]
MNHYEITQYQNSNYKQWNDFVSLAKNATFLFHRDFIEYHKQRFDDCSLMIYKQNKLVALVPANRLEDELHSHQGLTYGGILYKAAVKGEQVEEIIDAILRYLKEIGIKSFYLKQIPAFYSSIGNDETDFFLFKKGAVLYRKEMNLGINLNLPLSISNSKLKHFRKVERLGLEIEENSEFDPFWELVLEPRLQSKHQAKPVHSLSEIKFLKSQFPNNIIQYNVYCESEIIGGITIFKTDTVVKSQYGATTIKGEQLRAMDYLFIKLIEKYISEGIFFFDMGIVGEKNEKGYNPGLLKQKEELGCSIYNQDFYKLEVL